MEYKWLTMVTWSGLYVRTFSLLDRQLAWNNMEHQLPGFPTNHRDLIKKDKDLKSNLHDSSLLDGGVNPLEGYHSWSR